MSTRRRLLIGLAASGAMLLAPVTIDLRAGDLDPGLALSQVVKLNSACADHGCIPQDNEYCDQGENIVPLSGYNIHDGEQERK
jgi:hypothetical protein